MRSLLFLLLLSTLILFTNCSKEMPEPTIEFSEELLGEWTIFSLVIACTDGYTPGGEFKATNGCIMVQSSQLCANISFEKDGKSTITSSYDFNPYTSEELKYTINETAKTVTVCDLSGTECYDFIYANNLLSVIEVDNNCEITQNYIKQ